ALQFEGKTVVEAGSGLQAYTALHMLRAGASRVLLAEPKVLDPEDADRQLKSFRKRYLFTMPTKEVWERIRFHRDLAEIAAAQTPVDILCSYTVLEHVRDVADFFRLSREILKPGGIAYHRVDVSDHTYQFFARFPLLHR